MRGLRHNQLAIPVPWYPFARASRRFEGKSRPRRQFVVLRNRHNHNEKLRSGWYLSHAYIETRPGRTLAGTEMLEGLYKVEFETPRRKAVGIIFARDGKLHGGSSSFAYVGSYEQDGHKISGVVTARQHTNDPNHLSVFELNEVRIDFRGVEKNNFASVEGTAAEAPSVKFKAFLTRLSD